MIFKLPKLKKNKPFFIFGTGLMGTILSRQVNDLSLTDQLLGFIETKPTAKKLLNHPIYNLDSLTNNQIKNSLFLIASIKHKNTFTEQLLKKGVMYKQIITIEPTWSPIKANQEKQTICLVPPITEEKTLHSFYKKATRKLKKSTNKLLIIYTNIKSYKELSCTKNIKIIYLNVQKLKNRPELDTADAIYLWDHSFLNLIVNERYLSKLYFINPLPIPRVLRLYRASKKNVEQSKHKNRIEQTLKNLKHLDRIRVIFLVYDYRVWKIDEVFKKMLSDPLFTPIVLVCPREKFGNEYMHELLSKTYNYFVQKKYPVVSSYSKNKNKWVAIDELNPDIVFFCSPYRQGQNQKYYYEVFNKYPSIYIPYFFMATNHVNNNFRVYSSIMMQYMWKIYWPQETSLHYSKNFSLSKGKNGVVTGYSSVERIYKQCISNETNQAHKSPWVKTKKKRLIYAPHHTIEGLDGFISNLSTFTKLGEIIRKIAILFQEQVHWSFKPHPNLKPKLYLHPDWGVEKTDEYFNFWENQNYTQLNDGEYDDLFIHSDAIIHDCSSFIAEYLFTGKPCLYLINDDLGDLLNDFGKGCMKAYRQAKTEDEIKSFIEDVINELNIGKTDRSYFESYINKYYKEKLPSERIIEDIKNSITT